jgi:hypothetical protein
LKKKHLLTLILISSFLPFNFFTRSAQAQPPALIGDPAYKQEECFDSNPTSGETSGTGTISPVGATVANVYDGDLSTNINWIYGHSARGFVNVTGFKKPSDQGTGLADFNITYIDIKIHYRALSAATSDDEYRIVFYLGNDTVELQTWISGTNAIFPQPVISNAMTRPFTNVAKPDVGNWTWTDLANVKIGFETRVVGTNSFRRIYLHEIWITAYSTPYPETSTISVQPPIIWGLPAGNPFYVDIYVANVTHMWNYEILLKFNPIVLTATAWHNYDPFVAVAAPSGIWPDYVFLRYETYEGDPVGFTGNAPVVRVYFQINVATGSPLHFESVHLEDVQGNPFTLTTVDGYYRISEGDFEAPTIQIVSRSPSHPNYDEDVTVMANVTDNVRVVNVTLSYTLASEWHNTTMNQVGSLYQATIPAQPYQTYVKCKIYANDTSGNWAISDTFTYPVFDHIAPEISSTRIPNQPRNNQTVKIIVNATEPSDASGVKAVRCFYTVNGTNEQSIDLAYNSQSNLWEASIAGQPAHTLVEYHVMAQDNEGNRNYTETFSYTVALAGDANLDHIVDVVDAAVISAHWYPGPPIGPLGYDTSYDLSNDGVINIVDSAIVSSDWNKTW